MLHGDKVRVTKKALEIGNDCCLGNEPWTVEEIEVVWGIPMGEIRRFEATMWKKIYRRNRRKEVKNIIFSSLGQKTHPA